VAREHARRAGAARAIGCRARRPASASARRAGAGHALVRGRPLRPSPSHPDPRARPLRRSRAPGARGAGALGADVAPSLLASLGRDAPPVSDAQLELARSAWAALTSPTPTALDPLAAGTPALPAIGQAMHRLLEEQPWADTGLGRTERQLLQALADAARSWEGTFVRTIDMEERPFLGDLTAFAARPARAAPRRGRPNRSGPGRARRGRALGGDRGALGRRDPHSAGCAAVAVGRGDGARGAVTSDA
jgi:hypothetical protein